jgi:predicted dehydrogenase
LNAEDQLTEAFSKAAMFVEKPVSTGPVDEAWAVGDLLESRKDNLVSVGYMLRYSAAAQKMKDIIKENGLTVMMTSARYVMGKSAPLFGCYNSIMSSIRVQPKASLVE